MLKMISLSVCFVYIQYTMCKAKISEFGLLNFYRKTQDINRQLKEWASNY